MDLWELKAEVVKMETQLRNLDQNQDLHVENLKMDHLGLWCTLHHRGR